MKTVLRRTFMPLVCVALGCITVFLLLPFLVDAFILPALLDTIALPDRAASISRFTPFSTHGRLSLQDGDQPILSVAHFELRYSPFGVLNKRLDTLLLDHASVHLYKEGSRWVFKGLPTIAPRDATARHASTSHLPLRIDTLVLKECSIILHEPLVPDIRASISTRLSATFTPEEAGYSPVTVAGTFIVSDMITGNGSFSFEQGVHRNNISISLANLMLAFPDQLMPKALRGVDFGPLSAEVSLALDQQTQAPLSFKIEGALQQLHVTKEHLRVVGGAEALAVTFSAFGTPQQFVYALGPAATISPLRSRLTVTGIGSIQGDRISSEGALETSIILGEDEQEPPLTCTFNYSADYSFGSTYRLHINGDFRPNRSISPAHLSQTLHMEQLLLDGTIEGDSNGLKADAHLDAPSFSLKQNGTQINGSELGFTGHLVHRAGSTSVRLQGGVRQLRLPAQTLVLEGLRFELPIIFPLVNTNTDESGSIGVDSISLKQNLPVHADATIRQRETDFDIAGLVTAAAIPDLHLTFNGVAAPLTGNLDLTWNLAPTRIDTADFESSGIISEGFNLEALISSHGAIKLRDRHVSGNMQATVNDGTLSIDRVNLTAADINCAVELDRLPELISRPSQSCTIASLDLGTLHFSNTSVSFRVEDARTLFIEKSSSSWCRGTLDSGSLRLSAHDRELDTILYGNRINFADLLEQLGFDQTEGNGALNGKIPIKISKKTIFLGDGFLFSTPGTGGIVRFTNTDLLRRGMGAVQQGGYLDYSLEALKNFAYNWSKVSFGSVGDELLLSLELDGKPHKPLPFSFKDGMMVENAQGTGLQYPLRLDINFRLPPAALLKMGQDIKSIMGNK